MCPLVHFFAEASSINLSFYCFFVQPCSCFRLAWNTKNSSECLRHKEGVLLVKSGERFAANDVGPER